VFFDIVIENSAAALGGGYSLFIIFQISMIIVSKKGRSREIFFLASVIVLFAIAALASYIMGDKFILSIFFFFSLVAAYLFSDRYAIFLQIIRDEISKDEYIKSYIKGLDVGEIVARIKYIMEEEKIYRDENISLQMLSEKIEISIHQLSEIINKKFGVSFFAFINSYRIREAQSILEQNAEVSIIDAAYSVGFNSLSSFYTAFKKITGITPGKYQKGYNK